MARIWNGGCTVGWFNLYGIIILVIMMIPNVLDAKLHPEHFENLFENKTLEVLEQISRVGTFLLMVFNIPGMYLGFWFAGGKTVYLLVNAFLLVVYLLGWILLRNRSPVFRAYLLSVTPCCIFLFSGIMLMYYPLIGMSVPFAVCHIMISVKNAKSFLERSQSQLPQPIQ